MGNSLSTQEHGNFKQMMKNPQFEAPKFKMNTDIKDFYKFTVDDFELEGYEFNKLDGKFEVAV